MPQQVEKERIVRHLRPELEKIQTIKGDEVNAVVEGFTVLDSPHHGHVQYRLAHVSPEIERRSDIAGAIERAIHAAGLRVAGEE